MDASGGCASPDEAQASSKPRRFLVAGNWKCNGTLATVDALVAHLNAAQLPPSEQCGA